MEARDRVNFCFKQNVFVNTFEILFLIAVLIVTVVAVVVRAKEKAARDHFLVHLSRTPTATTANRPRSQTLPTQIFFLLFGLFGAFHSFASDQTDSTCGAFNKVCQFLNIAFAVLCQVFAIYVAEDASSFDDNCFLAREKNHNNIIQRLTSDATEMKGVILDLERRAGPR